MKSRLSMHQKKRCELGRHRQYKIPRILDRSKKARIRREEKAQRERAKAYNSTEKEIYSFLRRYAIEVLEAAGKGYGVDETQHVTSLITTVKGGE